MRDEKSPTPIESVELLRGVASGNQEAATEIFERYAQRLIALARTRLSAKLASRVDAEDIVQSAYRSFFRAAGEDKFEFHRGGDLWRLLVEMTLHKLYRSSHHHLAQQRSVDREQHADGSRDLADVLVDREPTPEEAAATGDELEAIFGQLNDRDRQAIELRLQGYEFEEIAQWQGCSERTARRAVNQVRRLIVARAGKSFVPSSARRRSGLKAMSRDRRLLVAAIDAPLQWNDYVLREQIGAGATGKVYRANRKHDDREFAIKFLRKSLTDNPAAVRRFATEAKIVAALASAGIVAVHGIGNTPGGGLFLLMDLLPGSDLEQVQRRGDIVITDALHWMAQAAETLHFAHGKEVIHCDLKPSNILLDATGRAHVTDFGFAVRREEVSGDLNRLAGTPAFMAPEQVDACWGRISPQTDIWGLGGVLYFLLYGRPPHEGRDVASTLANVVSKQPVVFPEAPSVALAIREILLQCLYKEPQKRIDSAQELARRLRSVAMSAD